MQKLATARIAALAVALASVASAAAAQRADVEAWSADWVPGFLDRFDDGVFAEGPGQPYLVGCAESAVEANGVLTVNGDFFPCKGFEIQPNARIPSGATMRALFDVVVPPLGASYGIVIKNVDESDAAYLLIRRGADPNGSAGGDTLFVELAADATFTPVAAIVLSVNPAGDPQLPQKIELELTLTPNPIAGTLIPTARYSECGPGVQPCSPRPALLPVPPVLAPPPDAGALAAGVLHIPAFKEVVPSDPSKLPFPVSIDEWSLRMAADDDFELAPLGVSVPYQTSSSTCGSAQVDDGALALDLQRSCPKIVAAFVGSLASGLDARASYRFAIPARCDRYGLGASAQGDAAELAVVRDGDGSLAIWLSTEPEPGGPALPIVERTTLSAAPDGDGALAGTQAVELRLLLDDDGFGALLPHGQFRLCATSPCDAQVPFEDLDAAEFPMPPPAGAWCGVPLAQRGAPSDGGRLAGDRPVATNLFVAAPEPGAAVAAIAAFASLLVLRRR